jgi:hypothetical protein
VSDAAANPPPIQRPNGRLYRPRKVSARVLTDEDGIESSVLVTGTHDVVRALDLARAVARQYVGTRSEPADPRQGWWRETIRRHDRYWEWDEVRGAAGVMFGSITEAAS